MRQIIEWGRLAVFLGFVLSGLLVAHRGRASGPRPGQRARVNWLLAYVLVVTAAVGFLQKESWPFSNWALIHHLSPKRISGFLELELLDAAGRGYPADFRIWEPLATEELNAWMSRYFRGLDPEARARVAAFMLARAEAARLRLRAGNPVGLNAWVLGPLAAPYHFQRRPAWRAASDVPATPFTGLRVWELEWDVEARLQDEGRVARHLLFEFHAPPAG